MRILAFDTSTRAQSVAITDGSRVLAEHSVAVERGHTSTLLGSVDACLREAGLELARLDLIAVGLGPGSFTGLRIGVACAKTLAFARQLPVVGVSSLAAMAHARELPDGALVVTANDARKGELYAAIWSLASGEPVAVVEPATFTPLALARVITGLGRPTVGLGNGFALDPVALHNGLGPGLVFRPEPDGRPRATAVADLGRRQLERHGPADLVALEPRYLRKSDAELNWTPRQA